MLSMGLLGLPWCELFWEPLRQWSRQIENVQPSGVQALSIIKVGSMSSPKEAELQSPLPGNGANCYHSKKPFVVADQRCLVT
jgi:hypothetical protein